MSVATFRRFLRPSTTLRWHPWAPLAVLALALLFALALGAAWGLGVGKRMERDRVFADAFFTKIAVEAEPTRPAWGVVREAGRIDAAVLEWSRQREAPEWRRRLDRALFYGPWLWNRPVDLTESLVPLAEFRIASLGGSAVRWQRTATFCTEGHVPVSGIDVRERYARAAAAYTELLGRTVRPEDLAPAVPGWRCEARRAS